MTTVKILTFSRKRGRPKINRPMVDTGTPETVMKRLLGITSEVLDLCLEHGIISKRQHWCGMHLRWLYTLRYGIPSVRAHDLSTSNHGEYSLSENEDPLWRAAREKEYNDAIELLNKSGYAILLLNLCIYNEKPKFLNFSMSDLTKNSALISQNSREIKDGLNILANLWKNS